MIENISSPLKDVLASKELLRNIDVEEITQVQQIIYDYTMRVNAINERDTKFMKEYSPAITALDPDITKYEQ